MALENFSFDKKRQYTRHNEAITVISTLVTGKYSKVDFKIYKNEKQADRNSRTEENRIPLAISILRSKNNEHVYKNKLI